MEIKDLSPEALERLWASVKELDFFTEEQISALCGYIPMTERLFGECSEIFGAIGDEREAEELAGSYPQFAKRNNGTK